MEHAHSRTRLKWVFGITVAMMVAEFIGGWVSGSLALTGDAFHMLNDALSLGLAFLSLWVAALRPTKTMSYGCHRAEPLASFVNGGLLILASLWISLQSIMRIVAPQPIYFRTMMIVALAGLAANVLGWLILRGSAEHSMPLRSAFLHVVSDLFVSAAVVVGGVVMFLTGFTYLDALLGIGIAVFITRRAVAMCKDALIILLDGNPNPDLGDRICSFLSKIPNVAEVHDFHLRRLCADGPAVITGHIVIDPNTSHGQLTRLQNEVLFVLQWNFGCVDTTFQFEKGKCINAQIV